MPPDQSAPSDPAQRRFAVDRARMFDIAKTSELAGLIAMPEAQRGDIWQGRFFDAVWNASIVRHDPPLFTGPDGFPYLRLNVCARRVRFQFDGKLRCPLLAERNRRSSFCQPGRAAGKACLCLLAGIDR